MENFSFGFGFELVVLLIAFAQIAIKTMIAISIIHYLVLRTTPITAQLFDFKQNTKYNFFTYQIAWLLITPIITGLFETFLHQIYILGAHEKTMIGAFSHLDFYLLSLTFWRYDPHFVAIERIQVRQMLIQGLFFLMVRFVLQIIGFKYFKDFYLNNYLSYWFHYGICPTIFAVLTIYYIRKNRKEDTN
jgi:hypothetical protein